MQHFKFFFYHICYILFFKKLNMKLFSNIFELFFIKIFIQITPIFFDYKRTPLGLKKMKMALDVFNTYLQRENSEYAAGSKYFEF